MKESVNWKMGRRFSRQFVLCGAIAVPSIFLMSPPAWSQAISVNGGSIQGSITDNTGAVVPGASVVITGIDTGTKETLKTDSRGYYSVGPLNPGSYKVTVNAAGFEALEVTTVIRTGTATPGSFKLTVGSSAQTVQVTAGAVQLNTDQAGVSDVVTAQQIETLPINGRNILDVAQLEPGVILQSGLSFDPTKAGYSAISVGGVSGRTTRILMDGQDITDETVGTTIINIPTGAIGEFQLNRSTQDVSGEVTSTGQVLMSTTSGTNAFHGQAFYNFQDYRAGAANTTGGYDAPFQRNQFGGNLGGPIIKDKLFFFGDLERVKQDSQNSATTSSTFAGIQAQYPTLPSPFRDTYSTVRLDYTAPHGIHLFARGYYEPNADDSNYNFLYSIYQNRDNTPGIAGGADFVTGNFTHSLRVSYEKFHNLLQDGTGALGTSIYNPANISPSLAGITLYDAQDGFFAGANYLAPQGTYQSDKQFRYDGSWTKSTHNLRYGYALNRILGGGFAEFFGASLFTGFGPGSLLASCGGVAGAASCPGDPLNGYSTNGLTLGNGNSVFTEKPGFGLPGGGTEDWRESAYISDNWKIVPTFTLTAGLRWSIDTDRANQDLPSPPCSSVSSSLVNPCPNGSGYLFDQFQPGLGGRTQQNYANFGPQLGFAYAPAAAKNTVLRGGAGIFYDSDIFNNTSNARSAVIDKSGPFFNDTVACGGTNTVPLPGGGSVSSINGVPLSTICAEPISQAAPALKSLLAQYQAATKANNTASNPAYIGGLLESAGIYAKPYKTPYAIQYNFGIQQQLAKGMILSADYVHNSTLKLPLNVDVNHVGAARYLNTAAAQNAINATLAACGVSSIPEAIISCPGLHSVGVGATINDFASNGLDSLNQFLGGYPATVYGLTPNTGAAFAGANPNVGLGDFILPKGQSEYNALQIVFKDVQSHPFRGVESANLQVSYSLSSIVSDVSSSGNQGNSGDQFFSNPAYDNDNPAAYLGPNGLDHKNEVSIGGSFTFKYGPRLGLTGHFFSAPPTNLTLDTLAGNQAQIFKTDVTGDGTIGDLVPGTRPGSYMRDYKGSNLNKLINSYNARYANQPTPAGNALIAAGLFTPQQLIALGAVQQQIATVPGSAINTPAFRQLDGTFSYPIRLYRFHEGMSIEPAVAMYNFGNFSNFTHFNGTLANTATGGGLVGSTPNLLNGPNNFVVEDANRIQRGSGTFDQGGPRTTEFQLKLNF